jgi:hypothetical protein
VNENVNEEWAYRFEPLGRVALTAEMLADPTFSLEAWLDLWLSEADQPIVADASGGACPHHRRNDHGDACLDCGDVYLPGEGWR